MEMRSNSKGSIVSSWCHASHTCANILWPPPYFIHVVCIMTWCQLNRPLKILCLLLYKRTNSMEHSPSWEDNTHSASQEITRFVWSPNVHYRVKGPQLVPILSQMNQSKVICASKFTSRDTVGLRLSETHRPSTHRNVNEIIFILWSLNDYCLTCDVYNAEVRKFKCLQYAVFAKIFPSRGLLSCDAV